MPVILGAGGAIGNELDKELKMYIRKIRIVGRNPRQINDNDELFVADLTQREQVDKAVEGAVAYLTVGLPYKTKIWQVQWAVVQRNTIEACKRHKIKLVFFDNIYVRSRNVEKTGVLPTSKKGKVRAEIAQIVLTEIASGELEALIARSANFYGQGINNSVLNEGVFKNLKVGKKANWFCSTRYKHNFTYTPDAAKATALLGNTNTAYGQVWHLPTSAPIDGKEWIETFAKELGVKPGQTHTLIDETHSFFFIFVYKSVDQLLLFMNKIRILY